MKQEIRYVISVLSILIDCECAFSCKINSNKCVTTQTIIDYISLIICVVN